MRFEGPDGKIMHAEFKVGDSIVMLADEMPDHGGRGPKSIGGTPVSFFVYGENVDAAWKRAVDAGAKEICRSPTSSGETGRGASRIRSGTTGGWPSTWRT